MIEIFEAINRQLRIETCIIVSLGAFDFPLESGCVKLDGHMSDAQDI